MSYMKCDQCGMVVDTDFDLESLYITNHDCLCLSCRGEDEEDAVEDDD